MKACLFALCLALLLAVSPAAQAAPAEPIKPAPVANTPAKVQDRVTSISVVLEGSDSIGARLGTRLKETFNSSSLFKLNEGNAPKLKLFVSTTPEFPSRPAVGSVYAICWVYSQGDGYLPFLLARECGTIDDDGINALVAKLVERTDGIAVKFASLWK